MEFLTDNLRYKHACDPQPEEGMFSRHAHHQYEFLYLIRGDVRCIIEQRQHHLRPGELVLIPPLSYHFIKIEQSTPYERAVIDFTQCDVRREVLNQLFRRPRIVDLSKIPEIRSVFTRFEDYSRRYEGEDRRLLTNNLLTELIYLISGYEDIEQDFSPYHNETIAAAIQYIEKNLSNLCTVNEICDALFISRSQLYQCFQDAFGIPPMQYIAEKRLLLAAAKIQLGEKPTQVAAACGFGDYSAFFRAYKKRFGHAPTLHPKESTLYSAGYHALDDMLLAKGIENDNGQDRQH